MPHGHGKIEIFHDFLGTNAAVGDIVPIQAYGVGTEVLTAVVDESGGVIQLATGGSDNDNVVLRVGPFAPRDGTMVTRARFKYDAATTIAVMHGFTETLDTTTPVMPAEFATTTMTYNGTGGMLGIQFDSDGTTDDFRAVMGDGGAAISDSSNGIRANATTTADRWFESEVILYPTGVGEVWFGHSGAVQGSSTENRLQLVKRFDSGTLLTTTDLFFPFLMVETRTGATSNIQVDYFYACAGRDWRND